MKQHDLLFGRAKLTPEKLKAIYRLRLRSLQLARDCSSLWWEAIEETELTEERRSELVASVFRQLRDVRAIAGPLGLDETTEGDRKAALHRMEQPELPGLFD